VAGIAHVLRNLTAGEKDETGRNQLAFQSR
jgi:hypothetical protein